MNSSRGAILLIDKPPGPTSFGVVERIRRWLKIRKVGHAGSLDPFATGLLVLCLDRATRLAQYITDWDKEYEGSIRLGIETDTDDPTGLVIREKDSQGVTADLLETVLERFRGVILQVPPKFSAKKRQGVASYRRARRGEDVTLPPVPVRIDQLEMTSVEIPWVHFRARCSKGTYMRSLARDVGRMLGCGGHLAKLTRRAIGHLRLEDACSLEAVKASRGGDWESLLWSVDRVLDPWQAISLTEEGARRIRYGQDLPAGEIRQSELFALEEGACVRLVGRAGEFLAVGRVVRGDSELKIHPEKVWARTSARA